MRLSPHVIMALRQHAVGQNDELLPARLLRSERQSLSSACATALCSPEALKSMKWEADDNHALQECKT